MTSSASFQQKQLINLDIVVCPDCKGQNLKKSGKKNEKQQYKCKDCGRYFLNNSQRRAARYERISAKFFTENICSFQEAKSLDIWDLRIFGKELSSDGGYTLSFLNLYPDWLKDSVKEYCWSNLSRRKTSTFIAMLSHFRNFSKYLQQHYMLITPREIDREIIVNYFNYLERSELTNTTKHHILATLKDFFEFCQKHNIIDLTKVQLIFYEDYPRQEKSLIKNIPPYILKQLDENLCNLPQPIALQIKILRETGMRISEICKLKLNCINADADGDWWIDLYRFKLSKEDRLLITKNLAEEIIEQQKFIISTFGNQFEFLFCTTEGRTWFETRGKSTVKRTIDYFSPVSKPITPACVRGYLYHLAHIYHIKDLLGNIYPIWKCHQFRHTHLTDLARQGVGIAYIMQRAGHESPKMAMEYIHLTDEDQKKKMKEVWDNTHFNIEGEIVAPINPELETAELKWIKKGMGVQTSDNGYCTLLWTQKCPYQNLPCKECGEWVTTLEFLEAHKKELEETEKIIENARQNGWQRQVEKNLPRAERLKKIIAGMEEHQTMRGTGHNDWEKEENNYECQ